MDDGQEFEFTRFSFELMFQVVPLANKLLGLLHSLMCGHEYDEHTRRSHEQSTDEAFFFSFLISLLDFE